MEKDYSQRVIKLFQILAEGCRKHPAYRARRPADGRYENYVNVWKARLEMTKLI